jgi:hypothetical protein
LSARSVGAATANTGLETAGGVSGAAADTGTETARNVELPAAYRCLPITGVPLSSEPKRTLKSVRANLSALGTHVVQRYIHVPCIP